MVKRRYPAGYIRLAEMMVEGVVMFFVACLAINSLLNPAMAEDQSQDEGRQNPTNTTLQELERNGQGFDSNGVVWNAVADPSGPREFEPDSPGTQLKRSGSEPAPIPAQDVTSPSQAVDGSPDQAGKPLDKDTVVLLVAIVLLTVCAVAAFVLNHMQLKDLGIRLESFGRLSRDPVRHIEEAKRLVEELKGRIDGLTSSVTKTSVDSKEFEKKLDKIEKGLQKDKRPSDSGPGNHAQSSRMGEANPNSFPPSKSWDPDREAKLQRERDEFNSQRKKFEDQLVLDRSELDARRKSLDDKQVTIEEREAEVTARERKVRAIETKMDQREQECAVLEAQAQAARSAAETARETASAEHAKIADIENRLRQWREEFWPKSLQGDGPLSQCRTQLEALSVEGKSIATLTSLSLAKCRVLLGVREDRDNELPKALHEVSRYLYQLWSETEPDPIRQAEQARKFKSALDAELSGRYTIRLAEVGVPKDQSWMTYSDGNTPVQKVHSWCVQNEKKVTVQRANVS